MPAAVGCLQWRIGRSVRRAGGYLVNTIMACGNYHTPRDADGRAMAEKAFSGGLTWTTPVFIATGLKAADLADIIAYLRTVPPLQ